jgi:MFS-type transporter involved in bile tolerance (Atg22 family)
MGDQSTASGSKNPRRADNNPTAVSQTEESVEIRIGSTTLPLPVVEWGGGILAALGFFLTPIFTAIPASYCALKIRRYRPTATYAMFALIAASAIFWGLFFFADTLVSRATVALTSSMQFVLLLVVLPLAVLVTILGTVYFLYLTE